MAPDTKYRSEAAIASACPLSEALRLKTKVWAGARLSGRAASTQPKVRLPAHAATTIGNVIRFGRSPHAHLKLSAASGIEPRFIQARKAMSPALEHVRERAGLDFQRDHASSKTLGRGPEWITIERRFAKGQARLAQAHCETMHCPAAFTAEEAIRIAKFGFRQR